MREGDVGIIHFLSSMERRELIHMIIKLHNANLAVREILSDMSWIETDVEE
jgi:hypothetical protein